MILKFVSRSKVPALKPIKRYTRTVWSKREDDIITALYPTNTVHDVLKLLPGKTISSVYHRAAKLGVTKCPEFLADQNRRLGRELAARDAGRRFTKGQRSHNKGQKYVYAKGMEKSWFSAGHKPANTKPKGTISIRKDRSGTPWKYIKLADSHWVMLHRHTYEQANGPIPAGHLITFRDKDTLNCELSNLELISMGEHAKRNHNPKKSGNTHTQIWEGKQKPRRKITPYRAAMELTDNDKVFARDIMKRRPDLVRAQQQNMQLKREIRYANRTKND
jgi:hypothetical protein